MSDQSRRSWMVTISQSVAGLGVMSSLNGAATESDQLPPGLYNPSTHHLSHALMSAEQFHPVVAGCSTDYIRPRTGPFKPLFFSDPQLAVLDQISDQRRDNQRQNAGTQFFELMKREAIRGFYTSRAGLKELDYRGNAYYARSPGCNTR